MNQNHSVQGPRTAVAAPNRLARVLAAMAVGASLLIPLTPAAANECSHPYYWEGLSGYSPESPSCVGFYCHPSVAEGPYFRLENPSCDPTAGSCSVQIRVPLEFPGVLDMIDDFGLPSSTTPIVVWFDEATAGTCSPGGTPPFCDQAEDFVCGLSAFGGKINTDFIETWVEKGGVTCDNAGQQTGDYSVRALVCFNNTCYDNDNDSVVNDLSFDDPSLPLWIGCPPPPPPDDCSTPSPGMCPFCRNGVGPDGGPPAGGPGGGPGERRDRTATGAIAMRPRCD